MSDLDWVSIGSAIVAVLALVANVFSAAGAARAADIAGNAEKRTTEGEALSALRELRRSAAALDVECGITTEMLRSCEGALKGLGVLLGATSGSREKLKLNEYQARLDRIAEAQSLSSELPAEASAMHKRQIDIDEALISVRGWKEAAARDLDDMQQERHRVLNERAMARR